MPTALPVTSDVDARSGLLHRRAHARRLLVIRGGLDSAIARALAYAPYADLIWCETSEPILERSRAVRRRDPAKFPGKMLAYNCSPSFNWKKKLDDATIARFQPALAEMGYKFQFITLAGFHALNLSMFELARAYKDSGMTAYSRLQEKEFCARVQPWLRGGEAPAIRGHRILRRDSERD